MLRSGTVSAYRNVRARAKILALRGVVRVAGVRFVRESVPRALFFRDAFHALEFNGISGDYVEFGSHGAHTFAIAYQTMQRFRTPRRLWAVDSFEGLPAGAPGDEHPAWVEGSMRTGIAEFHTLCSRAGVPRDAYETIEGFYESTIGVMPQGDPPNDIAFGYIDCDMLSSTRTVLRFLAPRLKHGMVIAFDDYYCWSRDDMSGERRAMLEEFAGPQPYALIPWKSFGWHGQAFIVETANRSANLG